MKVAFASDDQVSLAAHTGRCAGFMVYRFSAGVWSTEGYRDNPQSRFHREHTAEQAEGPHGTGRHSHAGLLVTLGDCDALVTRGMGARLIQDLTAVGIRVHVAALDSVARAMEAYARGDLPFADAGAACGHGVSHDH